MKIKKIILTALCLIMAVFALASCEENVFEEAKPALDEINQLYKPVVLEKATVDLYILTGDETTDNSITTVSKRIQELLDDRNNKKFDTTLNIHYIKGSVEDYKAAIADKTSGIALIIGSGMLDEMVADDRLADLLPYFEDAALKEKYRFATLNKVINANLLDASIVKVEVKDDKEPNKSHWVDKRFIIPNDHVIGSYDYLLFNKEMAKALGFSLTDLDAMTTYESTEELRAEFTKYADQFVGKTVDDLVIAVSGKAYEDKAAYEAEGYICNITAYPTVSYEEAAQAGFGVLSGTENTAAAMEIIYLVNSDVTLRNLLQYGEEAVNYLKKDGIVTPYTSGENVYVMDLRYTGNMFNAYYCTTEGWQTWTEDIMENGKKQNSESILSVIEDTEDTENGESGEPDEGETT